MLGVEMVEQPVRRGDDATLDGLRSPMPIAADESCTDRHSLAKLAGRYQSINVKLDKCGGLTEALAMCAEARRLGLGLMVGNMCGTSLAMAPAFLVAQACAVTDLDGPLLQRLDRSHAIRFDRGVMHLPDRALWG
jgi:L-alanine-DL-glutamate epimerase-like enolase superfamily enzyme